MEDNAERNSRGLKDVSLLFFIYNYDGGTTIYHHYKQPPNSFLPINFNVLLRR